MKFFGTAFCTILAALCAVGAWATWRGGLRDLAGIAACTGLAALAVFFFSLALLIGDDEGPGGY